MRTHLELASIVFPEPPMMMLDLATEGTLWQYIQKRKPGQQEVEIAPGNNQAVRLHNHCLTAHKMLALAAQIARGLAHLSKFRVSDVAV